MALPTDAKSRKDCPIATGVIDYFPDAIAEVARVSKAGNDQHNPGQSLRWDRSKSTDEADCLIRHFMERGTRDSDGQRHSAKVAWRALALLQKEIEADAVDHEAKHGLNGPFSSTHCSSEQTALPTNPRGKCLATYNPGSGTAYTCTRIHGHEGPHQDWSSDDRLRKEW